MSNMKNHHHDQIESEIKLSRLSIEEIAEKNGIDPKRIVKNCPPDILNDLKDMANKSLEYFQTQVIPKSVLDLYIQYLEEERS